ncbi:nicotinic acid mononucleotide adenylyltransferase [Spiroplasma sabaudiense Ar-1343]|uniref:Probable nicotinate-nucleotide adenylyltransferase n=1 Tax=Spiroplasma sabaudiense Ar-1343 TaxID=1276257 RepID=W6AAB9_9MOLU|nr:nicotinate-nucleotide adenylyltransferase [Spiroplasma sabaudiense]AHI53956.1 nicotinic acid mononucleotide adenylyltransferase [Spiroplasma sabaudiense Ar-1343]
MRKIALFGGSFDPVHTDHVNIAKSCFENLGFEEVWMIPTYLNPFKTKVNSSVAERLEMLDIVCKKFDFIKINKYEIEKQCRSYTFETIAAIKEEYPNYDFSFIMGSDQLDEFESWDHFDKLIKLINFKVFLRSSSYNKTIVKKYNLEVFSFSNNFLSSTKIRNLQDLVLQDNEINNYINNNLLYLEERVASKMSPKRFQHSLNVGELAKTLAEKNNLDVQKAWVAGTLHDVTKCWTKAEHRNYLQKWGPQLLTEPEPVWHSFTGSLHLEHDWLIKDQAILQAVFNHTVASPEMTPMDMVIFCADKVSKERNYPGVEQLREVVQKDLVAGFKSILKQQYLVAVKKHGIENIGTSLTKSYQHWVLDWGE